ncbi:hypothetical protein K488DRAFT_68365 [Vararia minispora EC-137]|uniref:Uncharacterized protein n=1 Tax=Vararia minispora EC-137 TaxID=1314806 RepID=A0ACB8QVS2_9AGAM|nr:hypothetical protein K488DRAFT_68365 [Vararia minispora EC-137]
MATMAAVPKLDKTMGAFYLGVLISGTLYGVYRYLISNFFNGAHLERVLWTAIMEVLLTGIIAMLVHGFYVTRIYQRIGAVAEFVFAATFSAKAVRIGSFNNFDEVKNWFIGANAVFVLVSCSVTAIYFIYLQYQPNKYRPSQTSALASGAAYVVDTGVLGCFAAIASLISVVASPKTFIYAPFVFCLGRFYAMSLLSTLNGTGPKRPKPSTVSTEDNKNMYQPRPERHRMSAFPNRNRGIGRDVSVHIDTVQYVNRDEDDDYSTDREKVGPLTASPVREDVPPVAV